MPSIEIDSVQRAQLDKLTAFVKDFLAGLPAEARMVFAIEMNRLFRPELDELRRRAGFGGPKS